LINKGLNGQRILITRPQHKQQALSDLLTMHGALVEKLAAIEIKAIDASDSHYGLLKQHILDLDLFDIIICISANAARIAGDLIDQYWPQLPIKIQWLAIGHATASALEKYDIAAQAVTGNSDSETLLTHPQLQQIAGKKVLILKGNSGRELLSEILTQRRATISEANLYNRLIPVYTDERIKGVLYSHSFSAILTTSAQAITNLTIIARGSKEQFCIKSLLETPLIVPSSRVANVAKTLGYQRITVAPAADDQSMIAALLSVKSLEADNEEKK
jgi:uroporphyrinogen-III synthase